MWSKNIKEPKEQSSYGHVQHRAAAAQAWNSHPVGSVCVRRKFNSQASGMLEDPRVYAVYRIQGSVVMLGVRLLRRGLVIFGSSPVDCPARLTAPAIAHSSYSGGRLPRTRHYGSDIFGCSPAADRLCQPRPLHRPRQPGATWLHQLFRMLTRHGSAISVASSSSATSARRHVDYLGWRNYFDCACRTKCSSSFRHIR
jgi:hypothetical protein